MIKQVENVVEGQHYFYPDYQLTVIANSQEEADKKVAQAIALRNK